MLNIKKAKTYISIFYSFWNLIQSIINIYVDKYNSVINKNTAKNI